MVEVLSSSSTSSMASVLKAQRKNASKLDSNKKREKRNREDTEGDALMEDVKTVGTHEEPPKRRRNKQRVLMLCSRGVTHRMRHLMMDLESLLPQVKKGGHAKLQRT
jgi:ribosome biogenesis protein BRX1